MSSINPHFTFHYSQPSEYRFSHDSVFLARAIHERLEGVDLTNSKALDLCAGCGIVGMDFIFHRKTAGLSLPASFDFIEVQSVYESHFNENKVQLNCSNVIFTFLNQNYDTLLEKSLLQKYDLIVTNPPYFFLGQGKLSPSQMKNRCRFFIDSTFEKLIFSIANGLKTNGTAYMLLKDLPEHQWHAIQECEKICAGLLKMEVLGKIRTTHWIELKK